MERPPLGQVEDLSSLAKLDEAILLDEINERYKQDKIYTYVGDILIAVNPFKRIDIYGQKESQRYQHIKQSAHPPHIFAVADSAYQALIGNTGRPPANQCVLISGESGAGKTESTKLIIKQILELCKGKTQLEQQVIQVNPLLEAFGNAQTNLNDNSSRFGKYIQLKFHNGHVVGAKISEYLLEKSRVVHQNIGEENFHIFYYLFAANAENKFHLKGPENYRYITNRAPDFPKRVSYLHESYEDLVNAMDLVGFDDDEQHNMFAVIASILHLGNVLFEYNNDDSVRIKDTDGAVKTCSKLLGIDKSEVEACLTCMVTVTKGEYVKRNYTMEQAQDARDAMAKSIYGRLFGWIVNKVNCLLAPDVEKDTVLSEIGILDIFGFEDFVKDGGKNSFEQACINLANEQLQFFFNQHIFRMEQEEYKKENIDWQEINFVDNKLLLDMFLAKPIGVLCLLDEESLFPKGTDQSFVDKLTKALDGNKYFNKSPQTNKPVFAVNHYAGKVVYTADKWLEKNRDTLPPGITELLQNSSNTLIRTIFRGQITRTGSLALQGRRTKSRRSKNMPVVLSTPNETARRKLTVGGQFKTSLNILMERMTASTPIFIRCLKPNHEKKAGNLDTKYVLAQLLYTGMLETVEIRRRGFSVRPTFNEFVEKYKILVNLKLTATPENCKKILEFAKLSNYHIGKTKVFLKPLHIEQLSDLLQSMGKSAIQLQRVIRGFLARQNVKVLKEKERIEKEALDALLREASILSAESKKNLSSLKAHDSSKPKDVLKPSRNDVMFTDVKSRQTKDSGVGVSTTMATTGTQMELSGSDSEPLDDEFEPVKSNLTKFGRVGTKHAAVNWFKETQTVNVMDQNENRFAEWFHGIISRRDSENLLQDKILGCYLIRVSESRFGYTLSFKGETRIRHYMIDQLKNGKFIIIGEPKVHRSLHDLVSYHKKTKISNWQHLLTVPCGQIQGECDYFDLVSQDTYYILEYEKPAVPARNYSVQSNRPQANNSTISSAAQHPRQDINSRSSNFGRPLPKLPEEAYTQLMSSHEDEQHKYKSVGVEGSKQVKTRVTHSRHKH